MKTIIGIVLALWLAAILILGAAGAFPRPPGTPPIPILLGMLDLVVAIATGAATSALASGAPGEVTTAPMAQLPMLLIPAYLVPLFVMLHLAALFQVRRQPIAAQRV
jgi:hypothetical protein